MYQLTCLLVKVLAYIPFGVLYVISDLMYYPLYYVVRYRRAIVRKNLTESFPEKGLDEIVAIEKRFYHHFMDMVLESCKLATIRPDEMKRRLKFVNVELVDRLLADNHPVAFFLGHFCNWEWMTSLKLWVGSDVPCTQVYHKLMNPTFDRLMKHLRERMGARCIEMHSTARFVAQMKAEGKVSMIALIADQSPKRREIKHYTRFLNHSVPVLVGPEKITRHFGHTPLFVEARKVGRGYYECRFSLLHDHPSDLPDYGLSDLYFERLDEEIRRQPECYLWTHNRFKYAKKE